MFMLRKSTASRRTFVGVVIVAGELGGSRVPPTYGQGVGAGDGPHGDSPGFLPGHDALPRTSFFVKCDSGRNVCPLLSV